MKLGIMSDSHDQVDRVRAAVRALLAAGAEGLVHCGDVGGMDVLEELAGHRCWFVWGNTDYAPPQWRTFVEKLGLPWPEGPVTLELAGKRIGVFHGHEREFRRALNSGQYDYILHGHTHVRDDYHVGATRVINPGALQRAAVKTVALLDLKADTLEFIELPDGR